MIGQQADPSFWAFYHHADAAGLAVVSQYEPPALLAFAKQALVLEQRLSTGCFILQAVLLVEYFVRSSPSPLAPGQAQAFGMGTQGPSICTAHARKPCAQFVYFRVCGVSVSPPFLRT